VNQSIIGAAAILDSHLRDASKEEEVDYYLKF